jgi:hypothetical protein
LLRVYGPANLRKAQVPAATLLLWLYKSWIAGLNNNVWEALATTAGKMFLSILPYSNGLWLANPLSLLRAPNKVLQAVDIINMTCTRDARDFPEPVDGVVLNVPVANSGDAAKPQASATAAEQALSGIYRWAYPPSDIAGTDRQAGVTLNRDRYYHFLSMPGWLDFLQDLSNQGEVGEQGKTTHDQAALAVGTSFSKIAPGVAREMYAQFKATRAALELTLPWREDLMPGTGVKVENSQEQSISFLGTTLYGMINSTNFVCDVLQDSPVLLTKVQLVAVRSEIDNQSPPTGFGLSSSALFQGAWVGMNLQGQLLADPPPHTPYKAPPAPHSSVPR